MNSSNNCVNLYSYISFFIYILQKKSFESVENSYVKLFGVALVLREFSHLVHMCPLSVSYIKNV